MTLALADQEISVGPHKLSAAQLSLTNLRDALHRGKRQNFKTVM